MARAMLSASPPQPPRASESHDQALPKSLGARSIAWGGVGEVQGAHRWLPEIRGPRTRFTPPCPPCQAHGAHWSLAPPQKAESMGGGGGGGLTPPTLIPVTLWKLLLSRFYPQVHTDECSFPTKLEP